MLLKIYVEDNELKQVYHDAIVKHNIKLNSTYPDAGFDLFSTKHETVDVSAKLNLQVKCAAYDLNSGQPLSYYLYPRSSISKTPLRLANSVGIIDSGYRGDIMCVVDTKSIFDIKKHTRYFQICSPTLSPIRVVLVNTISELGKTERGEGGFGSTGI
jgi:dUTP pyrophosphatase